MSASRRSFSRRAAAFAARSALEDGRRGFVPEKGAASARDRGDGDALFSSNEPLARTAARNAGDADATARPFVLETIGLFIGLEADGRLGVVRLGGVRASSFAPETLEADALGVVRLGGVRASSFAPETRVDADAPRALFARFGAAPAEIAASLSFSFAATRLASESALTRSRAARPRCTRCTRTAAACSTSGEWAVGPGPGPVDSWFAFASRIGASRALELDGRSPRILCSEVALGEEGGFVGVGARRGGGVDTGAGAGLAGDRVAFDAVDWRSTTPGDRTRRSAASGLGGDATAGSCVPSAAWSMRRASFSSRDASSAARRAMLGGHSRAARIVFTRIVASEASRSASCLSRSSVANAKRSLSSCARASAASSSASSCAARPIFGVPSAASPIAPHRPAPPRV